MISIIHFMDLEVLDSFGTTDLMQVGKFFLDFQIEFVALNRNWIFSF